MAEETGVNESEVNAIKDDILVLQDDLKNLLQSLSTQSSEKLMETKNRIEVIMKSMKGHAGEKFRQAYDVCCERSHEAVEKSREKITERPLTSIFVSFITGLLVGKLVRR